MSDEQVACRAFPERALLPVRLEVGDDQGSGQGNGLLSGLRGVDPVAAGFAELLGRVPWQQFWTLTFRVKRAGRSGGVHEEAADKSFRFFVSSINRELFGPRWSKRWHGGLQWARGQEFHRDGRLHFHAVASSPTGDLNQQISRYQWHEFWYREFGRNRIEAPRSQQDVAGYLAKYVTKGGTVDFSKNFGAWTPPPISYCHPPEQDGLIQPNQQHPDHPADRSELRAWGQQAPTWNLAQRGERGDLA